MKRPKAKRIPFWNVSDEHIRSLSIEDIEEVGRGFKDDLQRKANRYVRRTAISEALDCLESIEYIDQFIGALKLRAGSQLDTLLRPPRARSIHIPEFLRKKRGGGQ